MMKFFKILFLVFFLIPIEIHATAQEPDYLIVENDTLKVYCNPLEQYFEKNPIPLDLISMRSTANWRGYIAYFKFVDNKLVVENIYKEINVVDSNGNSSFKTESIYEKLFGSKLNFSCDFYSGLLICPNGKVLEYVHMGYSSLYENYRLFEINSGVNVKSQYFTGEEFMKYKIDYFKYYKTTDAYKIKAQAFKKMMLETNAEVDKAIMSIDGDKKKKKKENKYLKQKEAEYRADKELDSFMFLFLDDYMKSLEIPK